MARPGEMGNGKSLSVSGRKRVCFVATLEMTVKMFLLEHLRVLCRDYDVTVIVKTTEPNFLARRGVHARVITVPIERRVAPLRDLAALVRLYMIFRHERFDVVHSVMPKSGLLSMVAALLARIPRRVHTFTGQFWASRKGMARLGLKTLDTILAMCATHILVDSPSQRDFLVREGVVPGKKAMVLGHGSICGIDTERFRPNQPVRKRVRSELSLSESDVLFLFLGRLARDKGLTDLARAFCLVRKSHEEAHLLVVGPDEEGLRQEMESLCGSAAGGLSFMEFTEVPEEYMVASDVICLPSYREGFGIVVTEAASCGLPSVGTRIYGVTDAIDDGVTGILFEPKDVGQLADAMIRLLKDQDLRVSMGNKGRERVCLFFSQDLVRSAFSAFYRDLLKEQEPGSLRNRRGLLSVIKRLLDLAVALPLTVISAPVFVAAASAVLFSMGWPILFRQQRPGHGEKPFWIYKFRTMTEERDSQGNLLSDEARLTRVGGWLRRLSLDEIPQLFNVLRGDISLVGPRPLLIEYLPLYTDEQRRRHEVRPGITGWTQVNGRNALSWEEKFSLDVWYVDNWSLGLDFKIIGLTIVKVLKGQGVNAEGFATMPKFSGTGKGGE